MLCEPTARLGEHVAVFPVSATVQSVVAPSLNVTDPRLEGLPAADVTVAVKVSESPYALGALPVVSAMLVDVVRRAKKSWLDEVAPEATTMPVSGLVLVLA